MADADAAAGQKPTKIIIVGLMCLTLVLTIVIIAQATSKGGGDAQTQAQAQAQGDENAPKTENTDQDFMLPKKEADWKHFKATFSFLPDIPNRGFNDLPRTEDEAKAATGTKWKKFNGVPTICGGNFNGSYYLPVKRILTQGGNLENLEYPEYILGYDKNGFIASMISLAFKSHTIGQTKFDFENSKWYRNMTVNGQEVYYTEAFLSDPSKFCGGGRTQAEFHREGTGDRIWFYNKQGDHDIDGISLKVTRVPTTQSGVEVKNNKWYVHGCKLDMGYHVFDMPGFKDLKDFESIGGVDADCNDISPFQILYLEDKLIGFVWQHMAPLCPVPGWEVPTRNSIGSTMYPGRTCLMDMTEDNPIQTDSKGNGVRTMHVYLGDYKTYCGYQQWSKLRANPPSIFQPGMAKNVTNPKVALPSDLPRTIKDAEVKGWTLVDNGCNEQTKSFAGLRYAPNQENPEFALLFDNSESGHIAGMQSIIAQTDEDKNTFDFENSEWYNTDDKLLKNGQKVYTSTVYFVNTTTICGGGRKKKDFYYSGTGKVLLVKKKGREDVEAAPLTEDEAETKNWIKQKCTFEGGVHYFHRDFALSRQKKNSLEMAIPISISYIDFHRGISGFAWEHLANNPGSQTKWTTPNAMKAFPSAVSTYNQGIDFLWKSEVSDWYKDLVNRGKVRKMQVFLRPYFTTCRDARNFYDLHAKRTENQCRGTSRNAYTNEDGTLRFHNWKLFKTTWVRANDHAQQLQDQPRTLTKAEELNFREFPCQRDVKGSKCFAPPKEASGDDNPEFILIFDKNGYIAGMQSIVFEEFTKNSKVKYDFKRSDWYTEGTVLSRKAFLQTVYFVNPDKIAEGRSERDFLSHGTGSGLWFQLKDGKLEEAPLTDELADKSEFWKKQECALNNFMHYANLKKGSQSNDCTDFVPVQLLYVQNHLYSFTWQHGAPLEGKRWEKVKKTSVDETFSLAPQCMYDNLDNYRTMHVLLHDILPVNSLPGKTNPPDFGTCTMKNCCPTPKPPPKWEVFKTSWPLFDDQPRTLQDAKDKGWTKVSDDCSPEAKFPGLRYAPPKRVDPQAQPPAAFAPDGSLPEIIVIYDKNGYIAGIHHVATSTKRYDWVDGKQWFRTGRVQGKDVEMTTMYFVDPKLICGAGRTAKEFENQGTGNLLWLQKGPKYTDVFKIRLRKHEIIGQGEFYENICVPTMGTHWLNAPEYESTGSCNTNSVVPIQILTDKDGDVNGFVLHLFGQGFKGYRYEVVSDKVLPNAIYKPGCFLDYGRNGTIVSMHVYLKKDPGNFVDGPKITCPGQ